jgi:hypothetical protein
MRRPPLLMRVQIHARDWSFPLWLPLFLLLPLAILLLIILSPLILLTIIVLRLTGRGSEVPPVVSGSLGILCSVQGVRVAFDVLCSIPGLRVDVCNRDKRVYLSII